MHDIEQVAREIVDAAVKLHKRVGPGCLESVYEVLLAKALEARGIGVGRQKPVDVDIDGVRFEGAFRLDMLVDEQIVVEIKSVDRFVPAHWKQVRTYLRLLDLRLGFLLNFGSATMREGMHRIPNDYEAGFGSSQLRRKRCCCWRSLPNCPPSGSSGRGWLHPPGSSSLMP